MPGFGSRCLICAIATMLECTSATKARSWRYYGYHWHWYSHIPGRRIASKEELSGCRIDHDSLPVWVWVWSRLSNRRITVITVLSHFSLIYVNNKSILPDRMDLTNR